VRVPRKQIRRTFISGSSHARLRRHTATLAQPSALPRELPVWGPWFEFEDRVLYGPRPMQPRVLFARTSDDVRVAYWVYGAGPVLVQTPLVPFSHVEMEWQNPHLRRWYELLGSSQRC
jgi:hypothetical protein